MTPRGCFFNRGYPMLNLATSHFHTRVIFGAVGDFWGRKIRVKMLHMLHYKKKTRNGRKKD